MKRLMIPFVIAGMIAPVIASGVWETNMDEAKKKASEQNKGLLIEFTGSDWCGPCIHLNQTVLSQDEFLNAAQKPFVLVELDFPRNKEQSEEQKAHNKKYAEEYGVTGFPTVVFTNAEGKPVYSLGDRDMQSVLDTIEKAAKNKDVINRSLAALENADKAERVKLITAIFDKLDAEWINLFYKDLAQEVESLPGDPTGYVQKKKDKEQEGLYNEMLRSIPAEDRDNPEKQYAHVQKYLDREDLSTSNRQRFLLIQANLLVQMEKLEDAIALYQKALDVAPESGMALNIEKTRKYYATNIEAIKRSFVEMEELEQYKKSLSDEVRKDPSRYSEVMMGYLSDKKLTDMTRVNVLLDAFFAMGAAGKVDEISKILEEELSKLNSESSREKESLTYFKQYIDGQKEQFVGHAKSQWKTRKDRR